MRRKEREITDPSLITDILNRAQVCRVAMIDGTLPYIVPVCYGYAEQSIYFHCASTGRKIDVLRANPRVCFEVEADTGLILADKACDYGFKFRSVIGWGTASFIESTADKIRALDLIMNHYKKGEYIYPDTTVANLSVIRIAIETMTGKQCGY